MSLPINGTKVIACLFRGYRKLEETEKCAWVVMRNEGRKCPQSQQLTNVLFQDKKRHMLPDCKALLQSFYYFDKQNDYQTLSTIPSQ